MPKPDYDTSIARMAGNIASGMVTARDSTRTLSSIAVDSVCLARLIVAEIKRSTPQESEP